MLQGQGSHTQNSQGIQGEVLDLQKEEEISLKRKQEGWETEIEISY